MGRTADVLARPGSLADKLRARRDAIEAGNPEQAQEAYQEPRKKVWADLAVDGVTNNRKETHDDLKEKKYGE
jgi:hypothetical protein